VIDYAVIALLKASPAVASMCGGATTPSPRVYASHLPQRVTFPAIVVDVISDIPTYMMSGEAGVADSRVQVDCHALTRPGVDGYDEARSLAAIVRSVLSGFRGDVATADGGGTVQSAMLDNQRPLWNDATQTHVISQDWMIGYRDK